MNPRLYRLIETLQRVDAALRDEQQRRRPSAFRLLRLKALRLRAKRLIHRFDRRAAHA